MLKVWTNLFDKSGRQRLGHHKDNPTGVEYRDCSLFLFLFRHFES
jgi:hypothetical protein